MERFDAIIVGTGHGGAQAAIALRQQGFEGTIALIGRDVVSPYERPPLSKEYLAREKPFERIMFRQENFWADKRIDLLLGAEVVEIDPDERLVTLQHNRQIGYGDLVWSAGGSPRTLSCSGADLRGVHALRDKAHADSILEDLDAGAKRAVVIGGGFIGLETASTLTKLGCEVVVIEALNRVLSRVAGEQLSRFFEAEHRAQGVNVRLGAVVERFEGDGAKVTGVQLTTGEVVLCDIAIVGIGIVPMVAPLSAAGARVSNGVEVDATCRTNLEHIYAIGDCAAHVNSFADGRIIRLESVQNASDMANTAARAICGKHEPYNSTPWFWSNQYDLKLQTVGLSEGHDETVLRGDPTTRSFSVIYLKDGRVIALDCVNAMKDYVQGRKLVEARAIIAPEILLKSDVPLKDLLAL